MMFSTGAVGSGCPHRGDITSWNSYNSTPFPSPGLQCRTRRAKTDRRVGVLWEQITKGAIFPLSFSARPLLRSWQLSELSRCPREIWEGTEAAWHTRGWHCFVNSLVLPEPPAMGTVIALSFSMLKDPLWLGFHFKPHLFRCGNGWILLDFFLP